MLKRNMTGNFMVTLLLMTGLIATSVVYSRLGPGIVGTNGGQSQARVTQNISGAIPESTTYRGNVEKETTALELLQQQSEVKLKGTGAKAVILEINGKGLNEENREYWALYVNGKKSATEPADYILQDGDVVEWKIEQR